ncbi:efflux RND transporter periplasmic adaptor subunit [Prolixibacteraceae bacterium JC049]|jgi:HlyD family secretion protein|nr:efflux RND transporter periplasmic adaptor subunit [Prolixibacteraceae bacterium JC049]
MKKIFKILGIVVLIGIFVGTIAFLYNKSKPKPVVYEVNKPFVSDVIKKAVATGSVVPRKEIEIKPQVSGIIDEVYMEAGQMVKKGDIIAKVKIIPDMVNLNAAETRVNRSKINLEDSKIDFDRKSKLFDKKVIPYQEYQKSKVAYENAKEEVSAAENNLELVKNGVTKKSKNTTNTLIRSTIEGMILDVPIKQGNSVIQSNTFNAGTTIAIVADMNDMIFQGKVDETEVGKIKEGMHIEMTIGAIEDEKFDAYLEYISPKGVEENGAIQFEIKANVKLQDGQFIRAGYSANANIVLERKDQVMVISESLLKFENDSAFVEIETTPQVFEKRYIETGLSDGVNIEILKGLDKETKIKGKPATDDKTKKS